MIRIHIVERSGFWNRETRRLERTFGSGAEFSRWFDTTTVSIYKKACIEKMIFDYAPFFQDVDFKTLPRARAIRLLRARGIRVVKVRIVPFKED